MMISIKSPRAEPVEAMSRADDGNDKTWHSGKIAVVMVGLPATGKTFTARNLSRYLRWLGIKTKTFSVATYRTRLIGPNLNADFFDPRNAELLQKRTMIADAALQDMIDWFGTHDGQVGILDASNTQPARRRIIYKRLQEQSIRPVFIECLYNHSHAEDAAVSEHIRELRLVCPEYTQVESDEAHRDYKKRLDYYRPFYVRVGQEADERELLQFVRVLDGGERIETNRVTGYLPSRMLYYLMNLHRGSKRIFLYRLSTNGAFGSLREYALPAQRFLSAIHAGPHDSCINEKEADFSVWTETSLISTEVAEIFFGHELLTKPQLRGRDHGTFEGLCVAAIQEQHPEEYSAYQQDPYNYRYPRAESYHDLAVRLENVMMELEKSPTDVLILAEAAVLRCIYAYFSEIPNREIPQVDVPYNVVIELGPKAHGVFERRVVLGDQAHEMDRQAQSPVFKAFSDDAQISITK